MKINTIDLYSNVQDTEIASFSFRERVTSKRYIAKTIIGLDADEIIPRYYGKGSTTSKKFYNLALKEREIVIRIGLNPKHSVYEVNSDIRDDLYRAISISRTGLVQLRFMYGPATIAVIDGFIVKFEAALFSPEAEVQLTIRCDDPMFKGLIPLAQNIDSISNTQADLIDAQSTAPHGFKFNLTFDSVVSSFVITETDSSDWEFRITPGTIGGLNNFQIGDELWFSSEVGNKYLYLMRGSTRHDLVNKVALGSIWPIMFPYVNKFTIVGGDFTWNELTWYPTYWGV